MNHKRTIDRPVSEMSLYPCCYGIGSTSDGYSIWLCKGHPQAAYISPNDFPNPATFYYSFKTLKKATWAKNICFLIGIKKKPKSKIVKPKIIDVDVFRKNMYKRVIKR